VKRFLIIFAVLVAGCPCLLGNEWLKNEIQTFERAKKAVGEAADKEIDALKVEFLKALDGVIAKATSAGNLDRVVAAQNVKAELEGGETIAGVKADALVDRGRAAFDKRRTAKLKLAEDKLEALLQEHVSALKIQEVAHTKKREIDKALAIRKAREAATAKHDVPKVREVAAAKQKEPVKPITFMARNVVEGSDTDNNEAITSTEYVDFWTKQFPRMDKDGNGFLDAVEFPHPNSLRPSDFDNDGRLTLAEFQHVYRNQHHGMDRNKDGLITAADE